MQTFFAPIALVTLLAAPLPAAADLAGQTVRVEVPAGSLRGALQSLVDQTGWQVVYDPRDLDGRRAEALKGTMTVRQAVARLLHPARLSAEYEEFMERVYICPKPEVLPRQRHVLHRDAPLTPADTPEFKPVAHRARPR